jgi:HEAT repeat protein
MRQEKVALIVGLLMLGGCVTETRTMTGEIIEDKVPVPGQKSPVEEVEAQVRKRIDHLRYESGAELLKSIETIAGCKELALRPIAEAMPEVDTGVRANLVYTLSLIGGSQAHGLVTRQMSDESPVVRYEVAASLLQFKDWSGVPVLIGFLEAEDRRIRFKSFQALSGFAKQDFGYEFGAPEPERAAAVERWKTWWSEKRSDLVYNR